MNEVDRRDRIEPVPRTPEGINWRELGRAALHPLRRVNEFIDQFATAVASDRVQLEKYTEAREPQHGDS